MMHLVDSARGARKLYALHTGATQPPYQRTNAGLQGKTPLHPADCCMQRSGTGRKPKRTSPPAVRRRTQSPWQPRKCSRVKDLMVMVLDGPAP